jgi:hypothetical protein
MGWASSRRPPSAIFPLSPHMMGDNTDPTRAFRWLLGEGARRQKGGIKRFGGWGGGRYGCDGNGFFINALCMQICTILKQKKTKAKIARCSGNSRYLQTCCILVLKDLLYKCLNRKLRWIPWSLQIVHSYFLVDLTSSLQQTSWGISPGTYSFFWYSTSSTLLEISSFWK